MIARDRSPHGAACSRVCAARSIHGDLNDHNILVGDGDDLESRGQVVTGIVDFGDMVHSYRVGELAIAIAYAILERDDPLDVASAMVRGYCERNTLDDDELAALFGLVLLRLCASVCIAADQQAQRPDNELSRREPDGDSSRAARRSRRFHLAWPRRCFAPRPALAPSPAGDARARVSDVDAHRRAGARRRSRDESR